MILRSGLIASLAASILSRIGLVHRGTSFSSSCDDFLILRPEIRQIWEQSFLNRSVWWENLLLFSESSVACNQDWSDDSLRL